MGKVSCNQIWSVCRMTVIFTHEKRNLVGIKYLGTSGGHAVVTGGRTVSDGRRRGLWVGVQQSSLKPDPGSKPGFETKSKRGPVMDSRYRTWHRESGVGVSWNPTWNRGSGIGVSWNRTGNRGSGVEVSWNPTWNLESGIERSWNPTWNLESGIAVGRVGVASNDVESSL